ncbi:MAG: hypothetical protein LQ340_002388, partial [Diploschistes diacapsis]
MTSTKLEYKPSVNDVRLVKRYLDSLRSGLPIDIIDQIIDDAFYWPHTRTTMSTGTQARGRTKEHVFVMRSKPLCIGACETFHAEVEQGDASEPALEYPTRRVIWTIRSHDQGFSGEAAHTKGTYTYSYTGFDPGVERFHPAQGAESTPHNHWTSSEYLAAWLGPTTYNAYGEPLAQEWPGATKPDAWGPPLEHPDKAHYAVPNPPIWPRKGWANGDMQVQVNVQAKRATTEHTIVWDWMDDIDPESDRARDELEPKGRGAFTGDGRLVRKLQRGDCVTLWAHAFFPEWVNNIESASIE